MRPNVPPEGSALCTRDLPLVELLVYHGFPPNEIVFLRDGRAEFRYAAPLDHELIAALTAYRAEAAMVNVTRLWKARGALKALSTAARFRAAPVSPTAPEGGA